jgi:hypothetical protein
MSFLLPAKIEIEVSRKDAPASLGRLRVSEMSINMGVGWRSGPISIVSKILRKLVGVGGYPHNVHPAGGRVDR